MVGRQLRVCAQHAAPRCLESGRVKSGIIGIMTGKERLGIDRRYSAFSFKTQCHDEALHFVTLVCGMDVMV